MTSVLRNCVSSPKFLCVQKIIKSNFWDRSSCFSNGFHTCYMLKQIKKELCCLSITEKTVKPYGYLELSNVDLDLKIKPTNPDLFPNSDKAFCSFYSENVHETRDPDFIQFEEKLSLFPQKSYTPSESHCLLEIPIKYDVDAANVIGENSVEIHSLESGSIRITTGSGSISSKNIKGDFISLLSQSGSVSCLSSSQGRIVIQTGSGNIHGQKFLGPSLKISTNSGNISAESVYSDESHFVSSVGNIFLKNLHRKSRVRITGNGNLTISGMDGSLDAHLGKGDHQIQISQLRENSSVRVKQGSLTLKVPDQFTFGIRITAGSIILPENVARASVTTSPHTLARNFEYQTDSSTNAIIEIEADDGQVVLEYQDWVSSLGLGWGQ